jgi:hypothetical protein
MKQLVYVAIIALIAAAAIIFVRANATTANSNRSYPIGNRGGLTPAAPAGYRATARGSVVIGYGGRRSAARCRAAAWPPAPSAVGVHEGLAGRRAGSRIGIRSRWNSSTPGRQYRR